MYLSKIIVPWHHARNPYDIHKALWQLFPGRRDENRDFLFRVEKQAARAPSDILMQSLQEPVAIDQSARISICRSYHLNLINGQRLRFRLRANPVKKINDASGRINRKGEIKKCRVPLIREAEQRSWLERKIGSFCLLETLIIHPEMPLYFKKKGDRRSGKIQTVLFDGIFSIVDSDAFTHEIKKGIGPAKAFGCGLMSLAPA